MDRRSFCQQLVGSGIICASVTQQIFAESPSAPAGGSKIKWQKNLKTAQKLALQQDKPIMIVFGASWCTFCHKLERETLGDRRIAALIEREFIPVHLDFNKEERVAKILEVERLPSTVILTPQADLLLKFDGYAEPKEYQSSLSSALEKRDEIRQVRSDTIRR